MQLFHISDVLSVTTERLVSSRHMDGIYEILNFLTGDNLFTHQLPRAMDECRPWLRSTFPNLMKDSPEMPERLADLDRRINATQQDREHIAMAIRDWIEDLRIAMKLPERLPVYELGADTQGNLQQCPRAWPARALRLYGKPLLRPSPRR